MATSRTQAIPAACEIHDLREVLDELSLQAKTILTQDPAIAFTELRQSIIESQMWQNMLTVQARDEKCSLQAILRDSSGAQAQLHEARRAESELLQQGLEQVIARYSTLIGRYALTVAVATNTTTMVMPVAKPIVTVMGAGLAGLLAAYVLAKQGAKVIVREARTQAKAQLRIQNISFKEAEMRLRPLMGENLYQRCFARGAALDGNTGKLRITIGCFQEILVEGLAELSVVVHYGDKATPLQCQQQDDPDVIILATGVHSYEQFGLEQELQIVSYPEYAAGGRTALFLLASDEPYGYTRAEREGYHWRRANKSVFPGTVLAQDIRRVLANLATPSEQQQIMLNTLLQAPRVEYTFNFGNDTDKFLDNVKAGREPILTASYKILPMIARRLIYHENNVPVIALGDANGSAHPLAAIGTLKFIRNVEYLTQFVFAYKCLHEWESRVVAEPQLVQLASQLKISCQLFYQTAALANTKQVLFENVLSCVFSQKR